MVFPRNFRAPSYLLALAVGTLAIGEVDPAALPSLTMTVPVHAANAPLPSALTSTPWYLSQWGKEMPLGKAPISLEFKPDALGGNASCNQFRATFQHSGQRLTINRLISTTRKACEPEVMDQEKRFIQVLPRVQSYALKDNGLLTLTYTERGKEQTLTFIPASQFSPLHNSQWELKQWDGGPVIPKSPMNKRPTVAFSGDRLSGTGGCNRLMGKFTVKDNQLTIAPNMASTMMACPEPLMEQEQQFTQALTSATRYEITAGGDLVITYGEGEKGGQLIFAPQTTAAQGTEKTFYVGPVRVPCSGLMPRQCLQVKESPNAPWRLFYSDIEGFTFEPGFNYRLRVRETVVENPPADASSRRYTLITIEDKTPVKR